MRKLLLLAALCAALATPARAALSTTNSVITYTSNGVQTAFATGYRFLNTSHLVVTKTDLSSVTTTLVLGTDYSVTGANAAAGGTVTLNSAITSGWTLKIKRSTPKTQGCSLRSTPALPKTVEDCLDATEMQIQEMNDGTFTQLLATPVTTAQASTAAPIAVPNSANTNDVGSSASFAKADHVHQVAVGPFAAYKAAAGTSLTNVTFTIVNFGTLETDTDTAVTTGASWKFTVPAGKGGHYHAEACVGMPAMAAASFYVIALFKNAAEIHRTQGHVATATTWSSGDNICMTETLALAAADFIDFRAFQNTGGSITTTFGTETYVSIKRIQ